MEIVRKYLSNPLYAGIAGLIVGAIIGLVVLGWGLFPVKWVNASPTQLSQDYQVEYMRMAVESYGYTGDAAAARERYQSVGENADQVLADVLKDPRGLDPQVVVAFGNAAMSSAPIAPPTVAAGQATAPATAPGGAEPTGAVVVPPVAATRPATAETGEAGEKTGGGLRALLPIFCGIFLLLVAGVIVFFIMKNRGGMPGRPLTPAEQANQAARQAAYTDYTASGTEPPMAQFMASYKLGDDLFDDSFSIDSPAGEFMGECGVGISETIGVGDPKKVTAFEVWLFDKNDIQTVTRVLMSAHAFADDGIRQRLTAKGEPVRVAPGTEAVLETQTLQMVARVVDMGYGEGALPSESFFDRFILELAVWPKA